MQKLGISLMVLGTAFALLVPTGSAQAQATRTWVSGVGDDANPCSRTAPCKTFAGAISKTAGGGEISVLDPGGFGCVTATKSMTFNGAGTLAGILNAGCSGGVVINGAGIKVVIRDISIHGGPSGGTNGINYLNGAEVVVENVTIQNQNNSGIQMNLTGTSGKLYVNNVTITQVPTGMGVQTTAGTAVASVNNTRFYGNTVQAIAVASNGDVTAENSVMAGNASGVVTVVNGQAFIGKTTVSNNGTAFNAGAGTNIRISNNELVNNTTNFVLGGTISSTGNNVTVGGGAANPNGAPITFK